MLIKTDDLLAFLHKAVQDHIAGYTDIILPTTNGNGITKKSIDTMVRGLTKRFLKATGDAKTRGTRLCKR